MSHVYSGPIPEEEVYLDSFQLQEREEYIARKYNGARYTDEKDIDDEIQ